MLLCGGVMERDKVISQSNHSITIDNNKRAIISGVVEVVSSTDKAVVARTDLLTFQLLGEGLRVSKLDLSEKVCNIEGNIYKLEYNRNNAKRFLKGIFK